jgi:hypothetical protein
MLSLADILELTKAEIFLVIPKANFMSSQQQDKSLLCNEIMIALLMN